MYDTASAARMSTPVYGGILRCQRQERQYQTSDFDSFHANWTDILHKDVT